MVKNVKGSCLFEGSVSLFAKITIKGLNLKDACFGDMRGTKIP
jgi:hypothetical protein